MGSGLALNVGKLVKIRQTQKNTLKHTSKECPIPVATVEKPAGLEMVSKHIYLEIIQIINYFQDKEFTSSPH